MEIMTRPLPSRAKAASYCKCEKIAIGQSVKRVKRVKDDSFLSTLWAHIRVKVFQSR